MWPVPLTAGNDAGKIAHHKAGNVFVVVIDTAPDLDRRLLHLYRPKASNLERVTRQAPLGAVSSARVTGSADRQSPYEGSSRFATGIKSPSVVIQGTGKRSALRAAPPSSTPFRRRCSQYLRAGEWCALTRHTPHLLRDKICAVAALR